MNLNDLSHLKHPADIVLFLKVFFSLIALKILLATMNMPRLLRLLEPGKKIKVKPTKIEHVTRFSNFFLNKIFRSSNPCLLRSLILYRYLKNTGMDVKVVFGVKNEADTLKGHAWITHKEKPFLEQDDPSREFEVILVHP